MEENPGWVLERLSTDFQRHHYLAPAAQQVVRQSAEAMRHRECNPCGKDTEGHRHPSHQDAREICTCTKRQLSSKGTG